MSVDIEDIKKHWKIAEQGLASWRTEAKESYDFAAVRQWDGEDLARLQEDERPAVTFDRTGAFIDAVCGMEINNRQSITYLPVETNDVYLADNLSDAAAFFEHQSNAQDEDSEAVRDAVICGIGCTEMVMDYDENPDGMPRPYRRDPLWVWYDPRATRRNMADKEFVFYGEWISKKDAEKKWPGKEFSGEPPVDGKSPHRAYLAFQYSDDAEVDEHDGQVFILHHQCVKEVDVYRVKDPDTGESHFLTPSRFRLAQKLYEDNNRPLVKGEDYVKQTKKAYYKTVLSGETVLEEQDLKGFTFHFVTYKRDRNKRCWFGLLRVIKDPQRWANKWLSQILHIMNTNAKGGAFAEEGAFKDPRKAEDLWAQANPLILLREGGIDKIRERGQGQYPSGLDRLMMFAFNALPMATGLNLEVMGLADREQAGVLESQRRQSAYSMLAPLFAAIREYRKVRGKCLLWFIQDYVPEGTLIRILGKSEWVPLIKSDTTYDVKVEQAPDSPDFKKEVWASLAEIVPIMLKQGIPVPPELLKYSPLPPDVAQQWVDWIKTQGWLPEEHKQQMAQTQQQLQQLFAENQKLKEENLIAKVDRTVEGIKLQAKVKDSEERNLVKIYQANVQAVEERIATIVEAQKNMMESRDRENKAQQDARMADINAQVKTFSEMVKMLGESKAPVTIQNMQAPQPKRKKKTANFRRLDDGAYAVEVVDGDDTIKGVVEKSDGQYKYREVE